MKKELKVVTWNINSIRLRIEMVIDFLKTYQPDILCLQEIKSPPEFFPAQEFEKIGYKNIKIASRIGLFGVAVVSKIKLNDLIVIDHCRKNDCRHMAIKFNHNRLKIELHNCYFPSGGPIPDVTINKKYDHKLKFVNSMTRWFKNNRSQEDTMIFLGDFNIAPFENDVWSHKQLLNVVSHTEPELTRLKKLKAGLNWCDSGREIYPMDKKLYSWWSYRAKDWRLSNRGRRLDHIWLSQNLASAVSNYQSISHYRDNSSPSDHVPQMLTLFSKKVINN